MRQITLDGRIGKDGAKVMKTNTGKEYIRFSIANDAFIDGANKTEWFDVTCFDPYIVSKKSEYIKQGRYAIVQGVWKSEIVVKNGKAWLNQYITANNIELPSFGKREDNGEVQVSTYTGGTRSEQVVQEPVSVQEQPVHEEVKEQPVVSMSIPAGWGSNDDDLPF